MSITIKQNILTKSDCYKSGRTRTAVGMQLHTIGTAQNSASALASYWDQPGIQACVHYCVDAETPGLVYQFLPDDRRAWADAGFGNSSLITVELMESDYMKYTGGANYIITNETKFKADVTRAYNTAVEFFAQKCKEYGWNPQEKMSNGLYRISSHDEGRRLGLSSGHVDPTHIWNRYGWTMDQFRSDVAKAMGNVEIKPVEAIKYKVRLTWDNEKSQKGAFMNYDKAVECANEHPGYSVFSLDGKTKYTSKGLSSVDAVIAGQSKAANKAILATLPDYKGLPNTKEDYLNKVADIAVKLYPYTHILPSVVISQCCLENGFGCGQDAIALTSRNNLVGQKASLLNNTWQDYTVWDGTSFNKRTPEVYNGVPTTIVDAFRIFPNYAASILDYEMFLTHVKINSTQYKYRDVVGMTDPQEMITIISKRGYATGLTYISSVMRIINEHDLTKYDKQAIRALSDTTSDTPSAPQKPSSAIPTQDITIASEKPKKTIYRVQTGAYESYNKAANHIDKIFEKTSLTSFMEQGADGFYHVYCGSFNQREKAEERVALLKSKKLDAIIKEV